MTVSAVHSFSRAFNRIQMDLERIPAGNQALTPDRALVPGLYPSWGGGGQVSLTGKHGAPGELLGLEASVGAAPAWFTLNLELGAARLLPGEIFGFVLDYEAGAAMTIPAFLRSAPEREGVRDTECAEPLRLTAGRGIAALLHRFDAQDHAVEAADFHTLLLRLPKQDFRLGLRGLRAFVLGVEAAEGLAPDLPSLGHAFT